MPRSPLRHPNLDACFIGVLEARDSSGARLEHRLCQRTPPARVHVNEMVVKAKVVMKAYYGAAPAYAYWNGCSTDGRQGLMAAQRFADEYDGLVIGAPAINWDRFIPSELWPQIVMNQLTGGPISAAKLNAATAAAVSACDPADGVTDGIIDNPRACTYDPSALVCKADASDTCLSSAEADAIRRVWNGPTNA